MVDEFSSFARMPKPTFNEEPLAEIARQALFLHEVAHPEIDFSLDSPSPAPTLVCDRRLLGQALTNIVKNGVEAIHQKHEEGRAELSKQPDRVAIAIREEGSRIAIEVTTPAPASRPSGADDRTYMTTRAKGTASASPSSRRSSRSISARSIRRLPGRGLADRCFSIRAARPAWPASDIPRTQVQMADSWR